LGRVRFDNVGAFGKVLEEETAIGGVDLAVAGAADDEAFVRLRFGGLGTDVEQLHGPAPVVDDGPGDAAGRRSDQLNLLGSCLGLAPDSGLPRPPPPPPLR